MIPLDQAISYFDGRIKAHPREAFGYLRGPRLGRRPGTTTGPWPIPTRRSGSIPRSPGLTCCGDASGIYKLDDDGATADLNEAVRRDPNDPQSRAARGQYRLGRMRLDEALADANEAIRLAPTCPDGYSVRAGVASWKQEYDKALADLNRAIQLDPWEASAIRREGSSGPGSTRTRRPWPTSTRRSAAIPTSEHALAARGQFFGQVNRLDEALADADAAIRLAPKYPDGYLLRSGVSNQRHEFDKAIADATMGIKLDTRDANAFVLRGDA